MPENLALKEFATLKGKFSVPNRSVGFSKSGGSDADASNRKKDDFFEIV
jgi:hypothetical protein